jgi:hypothetical protein
MAKRPGGTDAIVGWHGVPGTEPSRSRSEIRGLRVAGQRGAALHRGTDFKGQKDQLAQRLEGSN